MEVKSVQQVGGFVALLVGTFQNQTKLSIAAMDAFTQFLTTDVQVGFIDAIALLLYIS